MKLGLVLFLAGCASVPAFAQTSAPACSAMSLGTNGSLNGFIPSPNDAWHQDISAAAVDPNSTKIMTTAGDLGSRYLHPDFSSIAGGNYGIPYNVVDSASTPLVPVNVTSYPDESDIMVSPLPASLAIEGSPGECATDGTDRHAIVLDRKSCVAYELYQGTHCNSAWSATQSTVWDFTETEQRPYTYTSADAAGLSVFEGLIRYDEIVAGSIRHAIRFTANHTKNDANNGYFTAPATHAAGTLYGTDNIMGMRIRLKASFDISGFSATNQIILKAMKQYGMILADNGSDMYFQGTPDARWNDDDLSMLKAVPSSAFEVVQMGPVYDSATAPTGPAPVITSFTASASSVTAGTPVVLTPTVTGASYSYIDKAGFVRGPVTVTPTATTTYTLTSRNAYGTTSASTTVTVQGATATTLVLSPIPDQVVGAAPIHVSATTNSTGTITYSVASGPAMIAGTTLTVTGAGRVTVQADVAAAGTYPAATAQTSFNVSKSSTTTSLTASANPISVGSPVTFTASVTAGATGTVTFADGSATLCSVVLASGSASCVAPALLGGSHSIVATYGGDANFAGSVSAAVTETVAAAVQDFSISVPANGNAQTTTRGSSANYVFTLTPSTPTFAATVSFAVTGLPAGVTATFSPASIPQGSATANATMTVQIPANLARIEHKPFGTGKMVAFAGSLLFATCGLDLRRRRKLQYAGIFPLLLAFAMCALVGCGSGVATTPANPVPTTHTYDLIVTATSGSISHTATVSLTVQ